jgi:hypothetical protein
MSEPEDGIGIGWFLPKDFLRDAIKMILASLRGLAVLLVLSAAAPLQGAHALAGACRYAGGSQCDPKPLLRPSQNRFASF